MACAICGRDCTIVPSGPGLTINHVTKETKMYTLTKELAMNADKTQAVDPNSPDAAYVLGVEGSTIPDDLAKQLGLIPDDEDIQEPERNPEVKAKLDAERKARTNEAETEEAEVSEAKMTSSPPADKAAKGPEAKK
jgi:hypothetical protein